MSDPLVDGYAPGPNDLADLQVELMPQPDLAHARAIAAARESSIPAIQVAEQAQAVVVAPPPPPMDVSAMTDSRSPHDSGSPVYDAHSEHDTTVQTDTTHTDDHTDEHTDDHADTHEEAPAAEVVAAADHADTMAAETHTETAAADTHTDATAA
jgi:hypothetical protein